MAQGEIVGLTGLLGAGRPETARMIAGADEPVSGSMEFLGAAFAPASPRAAIAAGIGFVTEDRKQEGIVPEMSVRENLTLALLPALSRAGIVDEAAQAAVGTRGSSSFAEKPRDRASGPCRRRDGDTLSGS